MGFFSDFAKSFSNQYQETREQTAERIQKDAERGEERRMRDAEKRERREARIFELEQKSDSYLMSEIHSIFLSAEDARIIDRILRERGYHVDSQGNYRR